MTDYNMQIGNDVFPGQGTVVEQAVREFVRDGRAWLRKETVTVDKDSVDAGNTGNTTNLRPGLVLVKAASSSRYVPVDHSDAPLSSAVVAGQVGILDHYLDTRDKTGTAVHKPASVVIAAFVTDSQIIYVNGAYKAAVQAALKLVDFR